MAKPHSDCVPAVFRARGLPFAVCSSLLDRVAAHNDESQTTVQLEGGAWRSVAERYHVLSLRPRPRELLHVFRSSYDEGSNSYGRVAQYRLVLPSTERGQPR